MSSTFQLTTYVYILATLGAATLYRLLVFIYVYFPGLHDANTSGPPRTASARRSRVVCAVIHGEASGCPRGDSESAQCARCACGARMPREDIGLLPAGDCGGLGVGCDACGAGERRDGDYCKSYPFSQKLSHASDAQTDDEVHAVLSLNLYFSIFIIRTLMPSGPSRSWACGPRVASPPYLLVYSAAKNALETILRVTSGSRGAEGISTSSTFKWETSTPARTPSRRTSAHERAVRQGRAAPPWRWVVHAGMAWPLDFARERVVETMAAEIAKKQWAKLRDVGKKTD